MLTNFLLFHCVTEQYQSKPVTFKITLIPTQLPLGIQEDSLSLSLLWQGNICTLLFSGFSSLCNRLPSLLYTLLFLLTYPAVQKNSCSQGRKIFLAKLIIFFPRKFRVRTEKKSQRIFHDNFWFCSVVLGFWGVVCFCFVFGFFSPLDTENWYTSTFFYYFRYIFGFFLSFHGLDMGFQKVMQKCILVNSPVFTCISNSLKILQSLECY